MKARWRNFYSCHPCYKDIILATEDQALTQTNMAQSSIPIQPMPVFDPDAAIGASVASRWNTCIADFKMFLTASGITDNTRKRALLLYQAGGRVREIFKQIPNNGADDAHETAKTKLDDYFAPQKNKRYEVYKFRQKTPISYSPSHHD